MKKKINSKVSLIAYGTSVPYCCSTNDLSIKGNYRVCFVELKNSMKPLVSCATNARAVSQNSNVYHASALEKKPSLGSNLTKIKNNEILAVEPNHL